MPWSEIMKSKSLNQKLYEGLGKPIILRRSREASFADVSKIATIFIKISLKYSRKVKSIRTLCIKMKSIFVLYVFLDWKN